MNKKCVVWPLLALLLIAGTAAGCKPAEPEENCEGGVFFDEFELRLCTDKAEYSYSEMVYVHLTITNHSEETLEFDGGSEAAMDILERNIRWSDSQELTPELTRLVLAPGESRTIEWTWPPSQAYLDELLGKRLYSFQSVSFSARLTKQPGRRPYSFSVWINYYPEGECRVKAKVNYYRL